MVDAVQNITIDQGATYKLEILYADQNNDPIPMPNHTARMQIRRKYSSQDVLVELTSTDGNIAVGAADGVISIEIEPDVTETLPAKTCVYDLELVDTVTGEVRRILQGYVTVTPEVTR